MYFDSWAFKNNYPHRLRISNGIRSAEHLLDVETALDRWVTTIFHDCFYYMMFYEWDQRSQSGALALDPNWCMCFADDLIACHYQVVLGLLLSNHPCSTMIRNGKQSLRAEQTHSSFQRTHFGKTRSKIKSLKASSQIPVVQGYCPTARTTLTGTGVAIPVLLMTTTVTRIVWQQVTANQQARFFCPPDSRFIIFSSIHHVPS